MKLEIIKQTKLNGDIFYYVEKDGERIEDSTIYGGKITNPEKHSYNKICVIFENVKYLIINAKDSKEIMQSEEI